jgi:hypothetical protein
MILSYLPDGDIMSPKLKNTAKQAITSYRYAV